MIIVAGSRRLNRRTEIAQDLDAWRAVASPPDTGIEPSCGQMQEYEIARSKDPFS
ncbi:MAG: hypothetical protein M3492_14255 [Actinomycetota bacterium]|nr:hypothetical protein [Actinomycetota bacterium]